MGHAQGLFARPSVACLLRPRPRQRCPRLAHTATVALANLATVIAATVVSQSAAAVALAATAIALAATACATLSLLPGRRRRLRRLRLRLCRRCPARSVRLCRPRRPLHCRGTRHLCSLSFDRASSRRFDRCAEHHEFLLEITCRSSEKLKFFSRGCAPHPAASRISTFHCSSKN